MIWNGQQMQNVLWFIMYTQDFPQLWCRWRCSWTPGRGGNIHALFFTILVVGLVLPSGFNTSLTKCFTGFFSHTFSRVIWYPNWTKKPVMGKPMHSLVVEEAACLQEMANCLAREGRSAVGARLTPSYLSLWSNSKLFSLWSNPTNCSHLSVWQCFYCW